MLLQLALILVYGIATLMLATAIWGMIEVGIEMFRHRDFEGIAYYDGGKKYDLSSWFDPLPGDRFYGHNQ